MLVSSVAKRFAQPRGQEQRLILQAAVLILLVMAAYLPTSRCGFVWDDDAYVTDNPLMSASDGLKKIWFSGEHQSQYFPLTETALRLGYQLWGLDPTGYHVVNVVEHCANVILAWVLLRKLQLPGAWLGAALFALHPVQVETVAWISELKNLQSTFFYLSSLVLWVRFIDEEEPHPWGTYTLCLLLYSMALLSKTTACTLPAALILVVWMRNRPIGSRTAVLVAPFCLLGLMLGLFSIWWEHRMGHYGDQFGLSFTMPERLLIAGHAIWFYTGKLIWPVDLVFSYPRWSINSRELSQYGWVAASLLAATVLWYGRRSLGRAPIAAVVFFVAALSPMLGFIQNFTFRYSFVADHYQYLACLGPLALAAGGLSSLVKRARISNRTGAVLGVVLLLLMGSLTLRQCYAYKDLETLMRDTIAKNPNSWMAHANLGLCALQRGQTRNSIECFSRAIQLNPKCFEAMRSLGLAMALEGRFDEALAQYRKVLEINPDDFGAYNNIGLALAEKGQLDMALEAYRTALGMFPQFLRARLNMACALRRLGRSRESVQCYREALTIDPRSPEALNDLAWILATDPDPGIRSGAEALSMAQKAIENAPCTDSISYATLAAAYAESGQFQEAVACARKAEELAYDNSPKLAQKYHGLAQMFLAGRPLRDDPRPTGQRSL